MKKATLSISYKMSFAWQALNKDRKKQFKDLKDKIFYTKKIPCIVEQSVFSISGKHRFKFLSIDIYFNSIVKGFLLISGTIFN